METLFQLTIALTLLIGVGSAVKIVALLLQMAMDTEDTSSYKTEIKHVIIVLIGSILAGSGALSALILNYF